MNTTMLENGCRLNDSWLAKDIRNIADKLDAGEIGAADVSMLIEDAEHRHMITSKILIDTICGGDDA
ncbi:MAG: hypothetical protein ACRC8W_00995 [Plesiomonas shigelloides]